MRPTAPPKWHGSKTLTGTSFPSQNTLLKIRASQEYNTRMKFFIDTANLNEIHEANALGILDGVTTNPSLMAKENIKGDDNIRNHYKAICSIVKGPISAEVLSTEYSS